MEIVGPVDRTVDPGELIQIELATKALELALIKVLGHDMFHKRIDIVDLEGSSTLNPRNNMAEAVFSSVLEHSM